MDSRIRKIRKLIKSPGLYFRDYLIKRYPIYNKPNNQSIATPTFLIGDSLSESLKKYEYQISSHITGCHTADISIYDLDQVLVNFASGCLAASLRAFYLDENGHPTIISTSNELTRARETALKRGMLDLRVVDNFDYLVDSYRILCWEPARGSNLAILRCVSNTAPIKLWAHPQGGFNEEIPTDLSPPQPIDVVFTWVNASDPVWQAMIEPFLGEQKIDLDRYGQADELRYALRSVELYAPWVRRIYVFTNCRKPDWFVESDRHIWIDHGEIIDEQYLPLFSSHAIETFLHRIPNLSDNFIYMNDDVMLFDVVEPSDFVDYTGRTVSFFEPYGMVYFYSSHPEPNKLEEWQHAAVNGARVIHRDFGIFPTRLHQHVPHVINVGTYREIENKYSKEIEHVRKNRFRSRSDISFTSFFYHHYANLAGSSTATTSHSFIIRNTNYKSFDRRITKFGNRYRFVCVNDGNGSFSDLSYNEFKKNMLSKKFPFKALCER